MIYRGTWYAELSEDYARDVVLTRHSRGGAWLVMGLVVTLMAFLGYLVYTNVLRSSAASHTSSGRALHPATRPEPVTTPEIIPTRSVTSVSRPAPQTRVPQSRGANALVGGAGPALLPDRAGAASQYTSETGMSTTH